MAIRGILEMLKTGTTCILEAMLTNRNGLENVVRVVEETGITACLVRLISSFIHHPLTLSKGELVEAVKTNPELDSKDTRYLDPELTSTDNV